MEWMKNGRLKKNKRITFFYYPVLLFYAIYNIYYLHLHTYRFYDNCLV